MLMCGLRGYFSFGIIKNNDVLMIAGSSRPSVATIERYRVTAPHQQYKRWMQLKGVKTEAPPLVAGQ